MHLESLIEDLGGFGVYQCILVVLITFAKVTMVSSMMMMTFAGVEPGWWCEDEIGTTVNGTFKNCAWNDTCTRHFETSMVTIVSEWDLTCDKKWINNMIISLQMAGVLIGSIACGYLADGYGRKKIVYLAALFGVLGNIVAAFSVNWIMFTILRILLGGAVGMMFSVNFLFMMEFVSTKYRGIIGAIPAWELGVIVFSGMIWGIRHWKWLHLAGAALAFPFLFGWFFVPESLRWLVIKGRLDEAQDVITAMAKYNKKPIPDPAILTLIATEEKTAKEQESNYSYPILFKTRRLAKKTILTCFSWFSMSVVYYTIWFGMKKLSGNFFVNLMIMAALELPVMPSVLIFTFLFGRRWSCASVCFLTAVCCMAVAFINRFATSGGTFELSFALGAQFFGITTWGLIQVFTTEQYPTAIRNLAYSAQNSASRVGGVLAGQMLSLGEKDDLLPPFIAMGVLSLLTGIACLCLRETKHSPLEDTMASEFKKKVKAQVETERSNDVYRKIPVNT